MNGGRGISYEITLRWMPLDLTDDKSTLVQVMAWCRQATSHYPSQCWPRFMSPNGVTRPQWVNLHVWTVNIISDNNNHARSQGIISHGTDLPLIARFMWPTWGPPGSSQRHGPRWTPCWPHEPCYQGLDRVSNCRAHRELTQLTKLISGTY